MTHARALSTRGVTTCRGCASEVLESILDLGAQPLANELLPTQDSPESCFPLHLRICALCGLGQLGEFVSPERIFGDYPYLSSVSTSWVEHARSYALGMHQHLHLRPSDKVVEIASNDGYLLREFQSLGVEVLGIEPAENVASLARASHVPTISKFFGNQAAKEIVADHGHPRLVVANNVMAHVPDLNDFVAGLASLCDGETVITVENPSFVTLLQQTQFDTIYHEHFSYLSAHAVSRLVGRHGLQLVRVERLPTHGGSYRYWIVPRGRTTSEPSVNAAIEEELAGGLLSTELWASFSSRSHATIEGLRRWMTDREADGSQLVLYGAAAKGNTLLNAAHVSNERISLVADGSPEKQGKFLPGSRIRVVAPSTLVEASPTDVLILPWNLAAEIVPLLNDLLPDATCWTAVPRMRRLSS